MYAHKHSSLFLFSSFSLLLFCLFVFVVVIFSVIIICNSVYIFTFNCYVFIVPVSDFGKGWVGRSCLYFLVRVSFGSFSLRKLTCYALCVSGAVKTQGFVRKFFMRCI